MALLTRWSSDRKSSTPSQKAFEAAGALSAFDLEKVVGAMIAQKTPKGQETCIGSTTNCTIYVCG